MKRLLSLCLLLCMLFLVSCGAQREISRNFFVMDTLCELRVSGAEGAEDALARCKVLAQSLETVFSATIEGGELSVFHEKREGEFSDEFVSLVADSLMISRLTGGAFDITVGAAVKLWESCEQAGRLPTEAELAAVLDVSGYEKLSVEGRNVSTEDESLLLHFGGIAKGYAADRMVESLREDGMESGMVSFVSSVSVFGERDFRIGLRAPNAEDGLCGVLTLKDTALSVSGDYERFYEIDGVRYGHILDPRSARSSGSGLHSVAVVAKSAALADALSTAVFVMGVEQAAELYISGALKFEFICLSDTGAWATPGMMELFEPIDSRYTPTVVGQ